MTCSSCGAANQPGRKFCGECGARLAIACPSCGAANEPSAKFCGECGTPLAPGGAGAEPRVVAAPGAGPAPVAERRLVSVLFADLVGFTALAEGRDPEETRELLGRYFELAREVIGRYGGTIEKFIGDAVMAVWGAPTAQEDDAERAVRAGLDLVATVRSLGPGIDARAGILTGEAAVTLGAVGEGMVAGDLVNTSSRLQAAAAPGTVLVGEATQRAASKAIVFEPAGEQTLKGKAVPVPAWRALRVVAERGGRNRAEALEAPFVGRDDELRLLKDLFHATARERRARLVSVTGPAGIGKTRLAWEFLKYLDGLVDRVWWHDGRSPAYGDGVTFWALGEMVRARCGLRETDDEATTRSKVAAAVASHVPEAEERHWIEPAILVLLGIEAGSGSEQLFSAWRTFFERLATTAPVVMVFEDFHFADSGLLDFVDHLMTWSRSVPIYVLTLARPELLEKRPDWGAGQRNFTSLYLEPLSAPAMRELLAGLVPGLPEPVARAIVARADGIPLYAVETIRMLVAQGKLTQAGNGAYRPAGDLSDLAIPETLTALISSRLDGLTPQERALVQDAAVLGQSFTMAGLSAVSGTAAAELEARLRTLVRREILALEADPRSPDRGSYSFVQALIREVAYNTLARADRKARHLAAARFFESLDNDELAGARAGHYLAARANATEGPERDALAAQARVALRGAAERAATLGAYDQAISFLDQAIAVTSDPADAAALHVRAAESAEAVQRADTAELHYRAAIDARAAIGDRSGMAAATAGLGRALLSSYRIAKALDVLIGGSREFADLAADQSVIRLNGQVARGYFLDDEPARAVDAADRVLEAAERADLVDVVADTLVTRGSALTRLDRRYEGRGAIETGLKLAASHGFFRIQGRALINLASTTFDSDPVAALKAAREGLALGRRMGTQSFQLLDNAAGAAFATGDWDWAVALLEATLADDVDPQLRSVAASDLMVVRASRGEPTDDLLAELQARTQGKGDVVNPVGLAWSNAWSDFIAERYGATREEAHRFGELWSQNLAEGYLLAARAAVLAGDAAAAREDVQRSDVPGRHGRAIDAQRTAIRAGIAALEGHAAEALSLYREALRTSRDLGVIWDEALASIEMATVLDPAEPEVRAAAEWARETLERLGARPLVARLERAMSRAGRWAQSAAEVGPSRHPLPVEPSAVVDAPTPHGSSRRA